MMIEAGTEGEGRGGQSIVRRRKEEEDAPKKRDSRTDGRTDGQEAARRCGREGGREARKQLLEERDPLIERRRTREEEKTYL